MKTLLWAEKQKLRHSKIIWITVFAVIMVAVIVFAQGQFVFNGSRYVDGAGWFMTAAQSLATFFVLPAVIALLGSYMICREEQEDTMKSLQLIPVDETKLTSAKMIVSLIFSILIYLLVFVISFSVEAILHFQSLSIGLVLSFLKTYLLDGLGIFFAISPIIIGSKNEKRVFVSVSICRNLFLCRSVHKYVSFAESALSDYGSI